MSELLQLIVYTIAQSLQWLDVRLHSFDLLPVFFDYCLILAFVILLSYTLIKEKIQVFEATFFSCFILASIMIGLIFGEVELYFSIAFLSSIWVIFLFHKTFVWFCLGLLSLGIILCLSPSIYILLSLIVIPRLISWGLLFIRWLIMFFQSRQKPAFLN